MTTGYPSTGWECATCNKAVTLKMGKFSKRPAGNGSFPVAMITKTCDCADDGIINRREGRFLSPEVW